MPAVVRARLSAVAPLLLAFAGCTTTQLRDSTVEAASTLTELQYQMVLDNLAAMSMHPRVLPWFIKLDGGSIQISDEIGAEAGVLESVTVGAIGDSLLGRVLLSPSRQTTQQWDVVPVIDPKELRGMQAAYRRALEREVEDDLPEDVEVPSGWFGSGGPDDVPPDAVFTGRYRDHRVWVMPDHLDGLSEFTLIILSIAELAPDERGFSGGITATPD